jgi:flagellar assembly protein FliH
MRNYTRFIPGDEIDAVASWKFGDVDPAAMMQAQAQAQQAQTSDEQAQILRQEGYAEGFIQGRAQAMLEAQRQINEFIANQGQEAARQLASLVESARTQLDAAEQATAQGVLELSCELARQVLRQEIASNPNVLLPVIREALAALFADSKTTRVSLHPLDLDMVQEVLNAEFPNLSLTLQADPALSRGGCRIASAHTLIDGSIEKRWSRAIAQLGLHLPWQEASDAP